MSEIKTQIIQFEPDLITGEWMDYGDGKSLEDMERDLYLSPDQVKAAQASKVKTWSLLGVLALAAGIYFTTKES